VRGSSTGGVRDVGEERPEEGVVGNLSTPRHRELQPEDEEGLDNVVPGKVVEDDTEGEALEESEEPEDNPVGEPLDVILRAGCFKGLERQVSGKGPAHEVGHGACKGVEHVEEGYEGDTAENSISFWDLGALLESVEDGIFRELFVELIDIIAGLILGLDVNWVLLNFLSCGHGEM